MVERAYKYRLYPNEEQKEYLAKTFGCCRFIYNYFLNKKQVSWKDKTKALNLIDCCSLLTSLKKEKPWLKEISSVCLQQVLRSLDKAYQNFFKKRAKYPKFKSKSARQSAHYMKNAFQYKNGQVFLAKMKDPLDIRFSRRFEGIPTSLTISKDGANRYFISILVKENIASLPFVKRDIAIDLGLKHFLINQRGEKENNPRFLKQGRKRLKRLLQSLCRKKKGSNNRKKAKVKVAKLHGKIVDRRRDFLHKISSQIVDENQVIICEDLKVKNMQKNRRLSFSIAEASWTTLINMLKYKSKWYGRDFVQVETFFPSSKICSDCGNKLEELPLNVRRWICPCCQAEHDRDVNAANNIRRRGLEKLQCTAGRAGSNKPVELVLDQTNLVRQLA